MDAEAPFLRAGSDAPQSLLSATGRGYFLLAVLGGKDEPDSHAVAEMVTAAADLTAWGRPVVVLGGDASMLATLHQALPEAIYGSDLSDGIRAMLAPEAPLPLIALCDSFGRVVYLSKGYNTSLAADLRRCIDQCR